MNKTPVEICLTEFRIQFDGFVIIGNSSPIVFQQCRNIAAVIVTINKVGGKLDNVSPSTLLKCCDALGLNPLKTEVKERRGQLADMRAGLSAIKGGRAS